MSIIIYIILYVIYNKTDITILFGGELGGHQEQQDPLQGLSFGSQPAPFFLFIQGSQANRGEANRGDGSFGSLAAAGRINRGMSQIEPSSRIFISFSCKK